MLGTIAEIIAVLSIIGHFVQYFVHKSREQVMLGFLHALKPVVESAAEGHDITTAVWAKLVVQINDMIQRLQPPKRS